MLEKFGINVIYQTIIITWTMNQVKTMQSQEQKLHQAKYIEQIKWNRICKMWIVSLRKLILNSSFGKMQNYLININLSMLTEKLRGKCSIHFKINPSFKIIIRAILKTQLLNRQKIQITLYRELIIISLLYKSFFIYMYQHSDNYKS